MPDGVIQRITRRSQPFGGIVGPDWSNPLLRNITRLIEFRHGLAYDHVTRTFLTKVGSGLVLSNTPKGVGMLNTVETAYWQIPILTETAQKGSWAWMGSCQGGTAQIGMRDSSSSFGTIMFWRNSGWDLRLGGVSNGTDYTAAGTFNLNTVYAACVTAGPAAAKIFVDGSVVVTGGAPPSIGTSGALISPWVLHQNGSTGQGGLFTSILLAIWDRTLPDEEAKSWTRNPWQVFAPIERRIWVPVSAGAYSLTAAAGSYALTGNAVNLLVSRKLVAAAGSYALTGNAAGLFKGYRLPAAAGTYSLTGNAAGLSLARKLVAAAGSYALTGNAVTLKVSRVLAAGTGSYTFTGNAAGLTKSSPGSYSLSAGTGSYALTGNATGLLAARKLIAAAGVFTFTGNAAGLLHGYRLAAALATYAFTGNAATLSKSASYSVTAGAGAYVFTGRPVTLTYSASVFAISEFWRYTVPADNLRFTVAADPLTYTVPADNLSFSAGDPP